MLDIGGRYPDTYGTKIDLSGVTYNGEVFVTVFGSSPHQLQIYSIQFFAYDKVVDLSELGLTTQSKTDEGGNAYDSVMLNDTESDSLTYIRLGEIDPAIYRGIEVYANIPTDTYNGTWMGLRTAEGALDDVTAAAVLDYETIEFTGDQHYVFELSELKDATELWLAISSSQMGNPVCVYEIKLLVKTEDNRPRITFIGDSITEGAAAEPKYENRYTTVLAKMLGMKELNMGISATVLCTDGNRNSRLGDIAKIPTDSAIVCIALGINDFENCVPADGYYYHLGTMDSRDTSTIYGAMHAYCEALKEHLGEDTMVFFMTPLITCWNKSMGVYDDWDQDKTNASGYTLRELCDAIIEVCEYHDVLYLDMNLESGLTKEDFADGLHPNNAGMQKMANVMADFIEENYQAPATAD